MDTRGLWGLVRGQITSSPDCLQLHGELFCNFESSNFLNFVLLKRVAVFVKIYSIVCQRWKGSKTVSCYNSILSRFAILYCHNNDPSILVGCPNCQPTQTLSFIWWPPVCIRFRSTIFWTVSTVPSPHLFLVYLLLSYNDIDIDMIYIYKYGTGCTHNPAGATRDCISILHNKEIIFSSFNFNFCFYLF